MIEKPKKQLKDKQRLFSKLYISATCIEENQDKLIVSPQFLYLLLNQSQTLSIDTQHDLANQILNLFRDRQINSLMLFNHDENSHQVQISLLDSLVLWILKIVQTKQQAEAYLSKMEYVLAYYRVSLKNLSKLTQYLSKNFHNEQFDAVKIFFILKLAKIYFGKKRALASCPKHFFFFYGGYSCSGIRSVSHMPEIPIKNAFCVYLLFNSFMDRKSNRPESLFSIQTSKKQTISVGIFNAKTLQVYYKTAEKRQPIICVIPFTQILIKEKWYWLSVEFSSSGILFQINKSKYKIVDIMIPKAKDRMIKEVVFGEHFQGMLSSMFVTNGSMEQYTYEKFPLGLQNWPEVSEFKNSHNTLDKILISCFPFCLFQVRYQLHCFDIFKRNHSGLGQNVIAFKGITLQATTSLFGGLKNLLPLFYLARFYDYQEYPNLLQHLLEMFLTIIQDQMTTKDTLSYSSIESSKKIPTYIQNSGSQLLEKELIKDSIILILSQHIAHCSKFLTIKCIYLLRQLDSHLQSPQNKKQFIKNMLWGINTHTISNQQIINQHFHLISEKYSDKSCFQLAQQAYSFIDIIYFLVKNYEDGKTNCCLQHYALQSVLSEQFSINRGKQLKKRNRQLHYQWIQNIASIVLEQILKKSYQTGLQNIRMMMRLLLHKYSTCLYLSVLGILKKQILTFYHDTTFLIELSSSKLLPILTYLSEKTIDTNVITNIIFIVLVIYRGCQKEGKQLIEDQKYIAHFVRSLLLRVKDYSIQKLKNPVIKAVKQLLRKKSADNLGSTQIDENLKEIKQQVTLIDYDKKVSFYDVTINRQNQQYFKTIIGTQGQSFPSKNQLQQAQWQELMKINFKQLQNWNILYPILKNFMLGMVGEMDYFHTLKQNKTLQHMYQSSRFQKNQLSNNDAVMIMYHYYLIANSQIRQLILKDLLQNLMINSDNLKFYYESYWLNKILLYTILQQFEKEQQQNLQKTPRVSKQIAIKIISNIFEQMSRNNKNITPYYYLLKSQTLLKKDKIVKLLYVTLKDILIRKNFTLKSLGHLIVIIQFQTLQTKSYFKQLSDLRGVILQQIIAILQQKYLGNTNSTHHSDLYKGKSSRINSSTGGIYSPRNTDKIFTQKHEEKLAYFDSMDFFLSLNSQYNNQDDPILSHISNCIFDDEVFSDVKDSETTFLFNNILAKLATGAQVTLNEDNTIKKIELIQIVIFSMGNLIKQLILEMNQVICQTQIQLPESQIMVQFQTATQRKSYKKKLQINISEANQKQIDYQSAIKIWLKNLTDIIICYITVKLCMRENQLIDQTQKVRMVLFQFSQLLREGLNDDCLWIGVDSEKQIKVQLDQQQKKKQKQSRFSKYFSQHFCRVWMHILEIMIYMLRDQEINSFEGLTQRMLDLKIKPNFSQLFYYFVKLRFDKKQQTVSNESLMIPLFTIDSLRQFIDSKQSLQRFIKSSVFLNSISFNKKLYEIIKTIQIKNWQQIKEKYFKAVVETENYNKKLYKYRSKGSHQELIENTNIQHLFDEENILQQQARIKYLHRLEMDLRKFHHIWKQLWNDLRIYHQPYGIYMAQKDNSNIFTFQHTQNKNYKLVMSKYSTLDGIQPILQAKIVEPWHIVKANWKEKHKYFTSFADMMQIQSKKLLSQNTSLMKNLFKAFSWRPGMKENQKSSKQFDVKWIQGSIKAHGKLVLRADCLIFYYDGVQQQDSHLSFEKFYLPFHKMTYQIWRLPTVVKVSQRRYLLKYTALQFLLNTTEKILFNFHSKQELKKFITVLDKHRQLVISGQGVRIKANRISFYMDDWFQDIGVPQTLTQSWVRGQISNMEYLIKINNGASRSIYDLSQYLVFPWVIQMNNQYKIAFRDLSKTLGALGGQQRRKIIMEKYTSRDPFNPVPPFFYGTHYSSPGLVFNFLIRLSPFTQYCKHLQGGKFDIADRLFSSFLACWKSAYNQVSDVRQLIPQFYYLPQTLLNIEKYNFGITQSKQTVNHVELPPWAANNPYLFILRLRQFLESPQVSEHLNKWIDLIFGYKQSGKQAQQQLNIYYYLTYEKYVQDDDDGQSEEPRDEIYHKSCQAQIVHFGQIPPMIFKKPHPQKIITPSKIMEINFIKQFQLMNSFSEKIIDLNLHGNELRILKRNQIQLLSTLRQPAILQKKIKYNLQKSQSQAFFIIKKDGSKAIFFRNYILIFGYLSNQFRIIHRDTGKLQTFGFLQSTITYIHINNDEDLILVGCQSGIMHIFQIQYDGQAIRIQKMAQEVFMTCINHISQKKDLIAISFGNYVAIYKIKRCMYYMNPNNIKSQPNKGFSGFASGFSLTKQKPLEKQQDFKIDPPKIFVKFMRSFKNNIVIKQAFILDSPLYGILIYDNANLKTYSINGQFIKSIPITASKIGLLKDNDLHDLIYYINEEQAILLTAPDFSQMSSIELKQYLQIIGPFVIYKNWIGMLGLAQSKL